MSEQHVNVIDGSDDDQEVDVSELQPLDDVIPNTRSDDPAATEAVVVAEPPAPPLKLPGLHEAPDHEARNALRRLVGVATSPDWLPPGLSPEIDAIRERHHDLISQLGARLATIKDLERRFAQEDRFDNHRTPRRAARSSGREALRSDARASYARRPPRAARP